MNIDADIFLLAFCTVFGLFVVMLTATALMVARNRRRIKSLFKNKNTLNHDH